MIYRGHVHFEPIHPDIIEKVFEYLNQNNSPLYRDVTIGAEGIFPELLSFENIQQTVN